MSSLGVEVDIVRKGYLKYKVSNVPNTPHKTLKEYWFVFRAGADTHNRELNYYANERDSLRKHSSPKGRIFLKDIYMVTDHVAKQFHLHSNDGTVHLLEGSSVQERDNWVFELNAVLFGKGPDGRNVVCYNIEVWTCPHFRYTGPGVLEIRHDHMIVWSLPRNEEVVRWQLGHIRSFKAKVNQLQIIAGSRSSTGEGTFVFGTAASVLITHTLETVIDLLANEKRQKVQQKKHSAPAVPYPYQGNSYNKTLVRGRVDSDNMVPGFMDVPGKRGPERLSVGNQPYELLCHENKPTRTNMETASEYSLLQDSTRPDIYSDTLSRFDSPPSAAWKKFGSLPRQGEYNYVDTSPTLVPLLLDEKSDTPLGEVRHKTSAPKQQSNGVYSTIDENGGNSQYSTLNQVERPKQLSRCDPYNTLSFKECSIKEGRGSSGYDKITSPGTESPGKCRPPLPGKPAPGYEQLGANFPPLPSRKKPSDDYNTLAPYLPPRKTDEERHKNDDASHHYNVLNYNEGEPHYETSPVFERKNIYNSPYSSPQPSPQPSPRVSPRVSPRMSPKSSPKVPRRNNQIFDEYDEVQINQPAGDTQTATQKYDEVEINESAYDNFDRSFKKKDNGEVYSKFNRSKVDPSSLPDNVYNQISFSDTGAYSTLGTPVIEGSTSGISFDDDIVPNALTNPDPDIDQSSRLQQVVPSWDGPPVPPRKPPKPQSLLINTSHDSHMNTKPKPMPKPKRGIIVD